MREKFLKEFREEMKLCDISSCGVFFIGGEPPPAEVSNFVFSIDTVYDSFIAPGQTRPSFGVISYV